MDMKKIQSVLPDDVLLRHRSKRIVHVGKRISRLYELRDALEFKIRRQLERRKVTMVRGVVSIVADTSPRMRRCRTVIGPDGTKKILQPGCATQLSVKVA